MLIPPVANKDTIINTLEHIDGLLLSGGADFNPLWCGENPSTALHHINAKRDLPELLTIQLAYNRQIPMLGICRGIQSLAIALGGKIDQDIREARLHRPEAASLPPLLRHSQDADRSEPTHLVTFSSKSILSSIYKTDGMAVNSFHHQQSVSLVSASV